MSFLSSLIWKRMKLWKRGCWLLTTASINNNYRHCYNLYLQNTCLKWYQSICRTRPLLLACHLVVILILWYRYISMLMVWLNISTLNTRGIALILSYFLTFFFPFLNYYQYLMCLQNFPLFQFFQEYNSQLLESPSYITRRHAVKVNKFHRNNLLLALFIVVFHLIKSSFFQAYLYTFSVKMLKVVDA